MFDFLDFFPDTAIWYADECNPYQEEKYYSEKLESFVNKLNGMFKGSIITQNKLSYSFRLYRNDSMGHNVATRVTIECVGYEISLIKVESYDIHPFSDKRGLMHINDGFCNDSSEWINHLQMHQVVDLLNSICLTNLRYVNDN